MSTMPELSSTFHKNILFIYGIMCKERMPEFKIHLLGYLSDNIDDNFEIHESLESLSKKTGRSKRSVHEFLHELNDLNILEIYEKRQPGTSGLPGKVYTFNSLLNEVEVFKLDYNGNINSMVLDNQRSKGKVRLEQVGLSDDSLTLFLTDCVFTRLILTGKRRSGKSIILNLIDELLLILDKDGFLPEHKKVASSTGVSYAIVVKVITALHHIGFLFKNSERGRYRVSSKFDTVNPFSVRPERLC